MSFVRRFSCYLTLPVPEKDHPAPATSREPFRYCARGVFCLNANIAPKLSFISHLPAKSDGREFRYRNSSPDRSKCDNIVVVESRAAVSPIVCSTCLRTRHSYTVSRRVWMFFSFFLLVLFVPIPNPVSSDIILCTHYTAHQVIGIRVCASVARNRKNIIRRGRKKKKNKRE